MDREHVKGAADKAKGAIKETAGKVSGDKELESEGKVDKAKGDLHNAAGNVRTLLATFQINNAYQTNLRAALRSGTFLLLLT